MIRDKDTELRAAGRGFTYTVPIVDKDGTPLGAGDLASLTLHLYDLATGQPLAGTQPPVDVKNTGRGSFDAGTKLFTLTLTDSDNALADPTKQFETHIAHLAWQVTPDQGGDREVAFDLKNLGP